METKENFVHKWMPVCPMDVGGIERWLGEMAAQGLFLAKSISSYAVFSPILTIRAKFQKGDPKPSRRYRLYPFRDYLTHPWRKNTLAKPPADLMDLYAASGWTYAANCGHFFVFYTDDAGAEEPFTDPASFRYALDSMNSHLNYHLSFGTAVSILCLLQGLVFRYGSPLFQWSFLPILIVDVAEFIALAVNKGALSITRRRLKEGNIQRERPLPMSRTLTRLARGAALVVITSIVLSLAGLVWYFTSRNTPLEEWEPDFDLLTLAEMEGDGSWTPDPDLDLNERYGNELSIIPTQPVIHYNVVNIFWSYFFADTKISYQIDQTGSGTSGHSSMDIEYYVCRSPEAALRQQEVLTYDPPFSQKPFEDADTYIPVEDAGAEFFSYQEDDGYWHVLARDGDRLLGLTYRGSLDLTDWFDEIADMLVPRDPEPLPPFPDPPVQETFSLSEWDAPFPLLTAAELEGDGSWIPSGMPDTNTATVLLSPDSGAPLRYYIDQTGEGTSGHSDLHYTFYLQQDAQSAQRQLDNLLRELTAPDMVPDIPGGPSFPFQEETVPGTDRFLVRAVKTDLLEGFVPSWNILALSGNQVLYLDYTGFLDLTEWYGDIADMLTQIESK